MRLRQGAAIVLGGWVLVLPNLAHSQLYMGNVPGYSSGPTYGFCASLDLPNRSVVYSSLKSLSGYDRYSSEGQRGIDQALKDHAQSEVAARGLRNASSRSWSCHSAPFSSSTAAESARRSFMAEAQQRDPSLKAVEISAMQEPPPPAPSSARLAANDPDASRAVAPNVSSRTPASTGPGVPNLSKCLNFVGPDPAKRRPNHGMVNTCQVPVRWTGCRDNGREKSCAAGTVPAGGFDPWVVLIEDAKSATWLGCPTTVVVKGVRHTTSAFVRNGTLMCR